MPTIIITRKNEWINRLRAYKIYINGVQVGKIDYNKQLKLDVQDGLTNIEAKIDWCSSNIIVINLSKDEVKNISVEGFKWNIFNLYFKLLYHTIINRKGYLKLIED